MSSAIAFLLAQTDATGGFATLAIFVLFIVVFYFLLIRPSQKQRKQHDALVQTLKKGETVVTAGGIFGKITQVKEDYVLLEIAKKTEIMVARSSISRREEGGGKEGKRPPDQEAEPEENGEA